MFISKYLFICDFSADGGELEQPAPPPPAKKTRKKGGGNKSGWSIPDVMEEQLVEWLRENTYLWLRSTKDYHRKKVAWEEKARELGISLLHLEKWWKNLKDWYVKLLKKTSGQARKQLTGRDKWVLNSLSFYKSKYISLHVFYVFIMLFIYVCEKL